MQIGSQRPRTGGQRTRRRGRCLWHV